MTRAHRLEAHQRQVSADLYHKHPPASATPTPPVAPNGPRSPPQFSFSALCSYFFTSGGSLGGFTIPVPVWLQHHHDLIELLHRGLKLRNSIGRKLLRLDIRVKLVERLFFQP